MKKVRIGVVGLGFMGTTHFRIHRANKNCVITAISDVDAKKRKGDISAVHGNIGNDDNSIPLDLKGVKVYEDALEMVKDPEVDMVDICVPTPWHTEIVVAALKAGKHVFCEKPLCRKVEELKKIAAAAKDAKGFLNFGMCVRAWPEYRHAYEYFKSGKAGKLLSATFKRISPGVDGASWKNWYMDGAISGGAFLDMHVHDVDEVNYFFGLPKKVVSHGVNICSKGGIDHVFSFYDYGDGKLVATEGGWEQAKGATFEMSFNIVCEKATLKLDQTGYGVYLKSGKVIKPKVDAKYGPTGWHMELGYFVDCIVKGVKPVKYQTLDSVIDSMKLVFAEERSIKQKKAIAL